MQTITLGNKKGLVFPVMSNGVIRVDYSDNIPDIGSNADTSDDIPYGIWGHKSSFCFETIITPYDVNGSGNDTTGTSSNSVTDSTKTFPAGQYATNDGYWSDKHLPRKSTTLAYNRASHKMAIFYSSKLKIYLSNATTSVLSGGDYISTTDNNPASYKIEVEFITGTTTTTLISDVVIAPDYNQTLPWSSDVLTGGFDSKGRLTHTKIETLGGSAHGGSTTFTSGTNPSTNLYYFGQELFIKDGFNYTSIGTVAYGFSGATVTLSGTPSVSLNSQTIYQKAPQEATYVNNSYHIGVSFDNRTKKLNILFNGGIIKSVIHSDKDNDFQLDPEDLYIGANGSLSRSVHPSTWPSNLGYTNRQFYGVFHELVYVDGVHSSFTGKTLTPNHSNTLLFLTFEEVDL